MSRHRVEVLIQPRPGLLDPEGKVVHHALDSLGFPGIEEVRVGRAIHLEVDAADAEEARRQVDRMCRRLLANPVTEDYEIRIRAETEEERR